MTSWLDSEQVRSFDAAVEGVAEQLRGRPIADRLFYGLSEAANHSILWHSLSALHALCGDTSAKAASLKFSGVLAVEAVLVNGPIKMAFARDRPETEDERPHKLRTPLTSSFPSGHASAAACAVTVSTVTGKPRLALITLAALVSWSRVHVRIHHGSDIVGGIVVGTVIGRIAKRFFAGR